MLNKMEKVNGGSRTATVQRDARESGIVYDFDSLNKSVQEEFLKRYGFNVELWQWLDPYIHVWEDGDYFEMGLDAPMCVDIDMEYVTDKYGYFDAGMFWDYVENVVGTWLEDYCVGNSPLESSECNGYEDYIARIDEMVSVSEWLKLGFEGRDFVNENDDFIYYVMDSVSQDIYDEYYDAYQENREPENSWEYYSLFDSFPIGVERYVFKSDIPDYMWDIVREKMEYKDIHVVGGTVWLHPDGKVCADGKR